MTKMRSAMPVVIMGAVVVFVMLIVLDWGMDITGMNRNRVGTNEKLGSINGKDISYKEFEADFTEQLDQQKQQHTDISDEQQTQIREGVWDRFVTGALVTQELSKLDLDVTDEQVRDILIEDPPSYLRRQFTDSLGNFDLAGYQEVISRIANYSGAGLTAEDKKMDTMYNALLKIEDNVREQKQQETFQGVLSAAVLVTDADVRDKFLNDNAKADAAYVMYDENMIGNDAVVVSDDDVKNYYDKHSEEFQQQPVRKIKYAFIYVQPSTADTMSVVKKMGTLIDSLRSIQDTARKAAVYNQFSTRYNELETQNDVFVKFKDMDQTKAREVLGAPLYGYSGLVAQQDGFHVYRILEERAGEDSYAQFQEILMPYGSNKDSVKTFASQMIEQMTKHSETGFSQLQLTFESAASRFSFDHNSAVRGGDMGYVGKGSQPKPIDDAIFSAPVGKIVGPIATDAGYVVLRVNNRGNREVRLYDIKMTIHISSQTRQMTEHQGIDMHDRVVKGENIDSVAAKLKMRVFASQPLQRNTPFLGSLDFTTWVFKAKKGDISEPKKVRGNTVLMYVDDVREKGVKPFEEVKAQIKQKLIHLKKLDALTIRAQSVVSAMRGDSIEHIKRADTVLTVKYATGITPEGDVVGVGKDYAFNAAVYALQNINQWSDPVRGQHGVFIIQLRSKAMPTDSMFALQKDVIRNGIQQQRKGAFVQKWMEHQKESAKIEDNREKFFQE